MRNHWTVVLRPTAGMASEVNRWNEQSRRAVWVGPHRGSPWSEIVDAAEGAGLEFEFVEGDGDLRALLRRNPRSPIVLCKTESNGRFEETLAALASCARSNPVLVVVDRPEFGDYYDLMQRGATYYYSAGEDPLRIALAIRRAAAGLSDEPRYEPSE